jgi:hypothetical protein
MSTVEHGKLTEYIQRCGMKNWDLNVKVEMPGEAGKQLFNQGIPLSDQSVVARAYGRKGGKAGKGKARTGRAAKGMAKTGRGVKGAANSQTGVMETPQDFLLALRQDIGYRGAGCSRRLFVSSRGGADIETSRGAGRHNWTYRFGAVASWY